MHQSMVQHNLYPILKVHCFLKYLCNLIFFFSDLPLVDCPTESLPVDVKNFSVRSSVVTKAALQLASKNLCSALVEEGQSELFLTCLEVTSLISGFVYDVSPVDHSLMRSRLLLYLTAILGVLLLGLLHPWLDPEFVDHLILVLVHLLFLSILGPRLYLYLLCGFFFERGYCSFSLFLAVIFSSLFLFVDSGSRVYLSDELLEELDE